MTTIRVYNAIPNEDAQLYAEAVSVAWRAYCRQKLGANHG